MNLKAFRQQLRSDNPEDRSKSELNLKKMLSLNSNFNMIERCDNPDHKDQKLTKKRKKTSKNVQLPPLMILGSDED